MNKINNPFIGRDNYNCFGCAPTNDCGLQMEFFEQDEEVICQWNPKPHFAGYKNILHGGIQSTLMDEIASWYVFVKLKTAGVTSKLEIKYKKPVLTDKGKIILKAKLKKMIRNIAEIEVKLFDHEDKMCSTGNVFYFTFDSEKAKSKLSYPGINNFIEI